MNSSLDLASSNYLLSPKTNIDHMSEIRILRHSNEMLQQQIHELKFRYNNLKKQQEIYHHMQNNQNENKTEPQTKESNEREDTQKLLKEQIKYLKKQLMTSMTERQNLQNQLSQFKEKIQDLKYHNQQLKSLNQKITDIHRRQIGILTKDIESKVLEDDLKRENQMLANKLQKCKEIVKEMQQFYGRQIEQLKIQLKQVREQNLILRENINIIQMEKQDIENQSGESFTRLLNEIERKKTIQKQRQDYSTICKAQSKDKKWEFKMQQLKDMYEREITILKDKIKYLIVKLESVQDENHLMEQSVRQSNATNFTNMNPNNTSLESNSSFLAQSKILLYSGGSNDSFRLGPYPTCNTSFSSSIKETLTKRETNCLKTPHRGHKNGSGVLADKN